MSNVTLTIGGRQFTVACAEGEESHVSDLGRMIDDKIQTMGDMSSQGEARMLLFASLLLADDLHESRGAETAQTPASSSPELAIRLEGLASELENLATRLEA